MLRFGVQRREKKEEKVRKMRILPVETLWYLTGWNDLIEAPTSCKKLSIG